MISSNAAGYALFKHTVPYLLQMASTMPNLWAPNSAIYISRALNCEQFEVRAFILVDTVAALAFGVPPLLVYDTTVMSRVVDEDEKREERKRLLEWVYGCPAEIVLIMAKVNAWRTSRMIEASAVASASGSSGLDTLGSAFSGGIGPTTPDPEEWRAIERLLNCWTPVVEQFDGASSYVPRLAVQESWRQGVFIYLYMGMCGVSSDDARVRSCVKQVVQLASTVKEGTLLEPHLFIPCLLAAAAARHESHRALLRTKLGAARNENIWLLRGIDFVPVMDKLWHGAGAGGAPVRWDDYVQAREAVFPIDA
ncbi:hypothetical protein BDV93DRAFT_122801 [Ceratobasidium sp. AG-I]|nr:hypothetical protein BDV93DRAFT_122801 [Ceratobasidium sp. AG-I]